MESMLIAKIPYKENNYLLVMVYFTSKSAFENSQSLRADFIRSCLAQ